MNIDVAMWSTVYALGVVVTWLLCKPRNPRTWADLHPVMAAFAAFGWPVVWTVVLMGVTLSTIKERLKQHTTPTPGVGREQETTPQTRDGKDGEG